MKKSIKISIATSLIAFSLISIGMAASAVTTVSITGTVEKAGGKYVLLTVNDVYVLGGEQIPAEIIGKEITVTGTVEMINKVKVIDRYIYDKIEPRPKKT
jgi:hypothetical protein